MRDINEYTGMARVEFLKGMKYDNHGRIYENNGIEGAVFICPKGFGIGNCYDCIRNCQKCWKQAIKDIKFKGDKGDNMEKKDLKNGMVVMNREHKMFVVVDDWLISDNEYSYLSDYNEDLKSASDRYEYPELDIIEIYQPEISGFDLIFEVCRSTQPIWKRSEVDWSKIEVDTKIEIKSPTNGIWCKRYFAKYKDGYIYYWDNKRTSFTETEITRNNTEVRLYKED